MSLFQLLSSKGRPIATIDQGASDYTLSWVVHNGSAPFFVSTKLRKTVLIKSRSVKIICTASYAIISMEWIWMILNYVSF